jgi:hypothetical protein
MSAHAARTAAWTYLRHRLDAFTLEAQRTWHVHMLQTQLTKVGAPTIATDGDWKPAIRFDDASATQAIASARAGDLDAARLLDDAVRWHNAQGEVLPPNLLAYVRDPGLPAKMKTSHKANGMAPRNEIIVEAVRLACEAGGVKATRSDATDEDTPTGCAIVAALLDEHGLKPRSYSGVRKIWKERARVGQT